MSDFLPIDIQVKNEDKNVVISWTDGHMSKLPIQRLRGFCPCAECQGHQPQLKWHDNQTHAILKAELVGRYAINFQFADGHKTGLFRWDFLRELENKSH